MAVKILKIWHKWSWAFHIGAWMLAAIIYVTTFQNGVAQTAKEVAVIQDQKLPERMARQEQTTQDIGNDIREIKEVQSKIFDRINQLADMRPAR